MANRYFILKNPVTLEAMITDLLDEAPENSVLYFDNSFYIPKLDQYPGPTSVGEGATPEEIAEFQGSDVPATLPKMRFKLQLIACGITIESVNTMISNIANPVFREVVYVKFNDCDYLERNDPILNQFAADMNISQQQLDSIFREEYTLQMKK